MTVLIGWVFTLMLHRPQEAEMSERFAPPGYQGNFWGPEATKARHEGRTRPIIATAHMARWDRWGRKILRDGDILFRLGDARVARGYFPMSRFLAQASNSKFSHTGIVAIEVEGPVVYDMTRFGVCRVPFCVWALDNIGWIGVKRLRPEYKDSVPKVLAFLRKVFEEQVPFDYQLSEDDHAFYCIELTEKAYRSAGIVLSKPIRLGDMERAPEFPFQMLGIEIASKYVLERPLSFDQRVFFPGNENHGIWSARQLVTVVPPTFAPGHPDYKLFIDKDTFLTTPGSLSSSRKVADPNLADPGTTARRERSGT